MSLKSENRPNPQETFPSHHWHALSRDKALHMVTSTPLGLKIEDAQFRINRYGRNDVTVKSSQTAFKIFFDQFKSPLIYILAIAGVISLVLGHFVDGAIILGAVVLNTIIGFFQELKVSNILDELRKVVSYQTTVIRLGKEHIVDAKDITIGDVIVLRQGDKVPADARLLKSSNFRTSEAALSGESTPVDKDPNVIHDVETEIADRTNMVFMGTSVEQGVAQAVVVSIGLQTEFGQIAALVQNKQEQTPLQRKLGKLAGNLGFLFLGLSVLLFVVGILRGIDALTMFLTAVAVAVAAVPESLPISLSATLAVGAKRIFAKGGLIRKMIGAEALGSTTVICADKTATMTEGKMSLTHIVTADKQEITSDRFLDIVENSQQTTALTILQLLSLAHNATIENPEDPMTDWRIQGRPIDRAALLATKSVGIDASTFSGTVRRIAEVPFDSRNKYSAVLHHFTEENAVVKNNKDKGLVTAMGAAEIFIPKCTYVYRNHEPVKMTPQDQETLVQQVNELAAKGFKLLAIGYKEVPKKITELDVDMLESMTFLGLIAFSDPIRDEVRDAIHVAQAAGVRVLMITGDHRLTAQYVAAEVGIIDKGDTSRVIQGKDLPADFDQAIFDYDVFARVSPSDKLSIVQALKKHDEAVAMIGDGINDTPALLKADLGVTVGSGTDVAKEAADLILMNDSFAIIVEAIRQGRVILDNIKKSLLYLLSSSFTEIVIIAGSILSGNPLALLPAQILWVNIVADGIPAISLAFETKEGDVMRRGPESSQNIFTPGMRKTITLFAVITNLVLLGLFFFLIGNHEIEYVRTMVFIGLGLTSLLYVFSLKSLRTPIWRTNLFDNKIMLGGVIGGIFLYLIAVYWTPTQKLLETVPLSLQDWIVLTILGIFNIVVIEWSKQKFLSKQMGI